MSTELGHYHSDGANKQAQAVLAMLQYNIDDGIESSWNSEFKRYDASIKIARWKNCREQGYVVSLASKNYARQINIAFFEHRNSDGICAVKWEGRILNSPTINDIPQEVYADKWDVSHSVDVGHIDEMATWIAGELIAFWKGATQ